MYTDDHSDDFERREQLRLRRLGTTTPRCCLCGETDSRCLELHHIEGQANGKTLCVVCRNCHRKLSDAQRDHPKPETVEDVELNAFANFLLGLADLIALAVEKLREIARELIARATGQKPRSEGATP
jgi:hypothetical protein